MSKLKPVMLPAEPKPETIVAIIDSREQQPFELAPLRSMRAGLPTGDYSIKGLEDVVALERKSLSDLVGCFGAERDRFEAELTRLRSYATRAVIVEASWADLLAGAWRSKVTPESATGSVLAWMGQGIPFLFAGDREAAQRATVRLLYIAARRRWREARALVLGAICE